jgi:2-C-methyl-D-erythritol 2,4-cyclodiphosphate synthase
MQENATKLPDLRIGQGIDFHAFVTGRPLILGGVEIPCDQGLAGHSDADALIHALCDALLGALALGDIGTHFPDSDPQWKGVDSRILLRESSRRIADRGWQLANADLTVLAQKPRLASHIPEMQRRLAADLDVTPDRISIKATTTERLGAVGREEGIAAWAVVLLVRRLS